MNEIVKPFKKYGAPMGRFVYALTMAAVFLLQAGTPAQAVKGPPGVVSGPHNLSINTLYAGGYQSDEQEVCVFCHTPHGASSAGPLWNKPLTSGPFVQYTTDVGANAELQDDARPVSDQSKLCLSCHDGTATVYAVINLPNTRNGLPIASFSGGDPNVQMVPGWGAYQPVLDVDLSNDHPISFSYDQVLVDFASAGLASRLRSVAQAQTAGVRFFNAGNYVECSTCHDPHVDYSAGGDPNYTPFLITPNANSALCLACHVK